MSQAPAPRFIPAGLTPTAEQRAIQLSRNRVTLAEANAGAAKTTTLALRIGEALARGLPPEDILALTFTEQARDVMRARLAEIGIPRSTAARVTALTMDEFARQALANLEDGPPPAVTADRDLKDAALEALETVPRAHARYADQLDIRTHNMAVSQFLDTLLRLKATMALDGTAAGAADTDDDGADDADPVAAADALNVPLTDYLWALEYESLRQGGLGEVLFRGPFDATYDLARLLGDDPLAAQALPDYRLVLGDELHDLNEASFRVLAALLSRERTYFVGAGDRDQVIHSQFGADPQYLERRFSERFPRTARYPLTQTYRHGPHLAGAMAAFKNKPVESALPLHTRIVEAHYDPARPGACAALAVQALREWKAARQPLQGCAILLRDRHQSIDIENALMQAGIGYRTGAMSSYLRREEILFLRGMLAIALDNLAAVQSPSVRGAIVEALAIFGEVPLPPDELEEAKRAIASEPAALRFFFQGQIQRVGNPAASARITRAVETVRALPPGAPAHEALASVCAQIDMEALARRIYVRPCDAAVINRSVQGFIAMARQSGMDLAALADWLGAADAYVDTRRRKDLVLLDCAPHAKGQEFEHVLLPYLETGEFPDPLRDPQEEDNLFYVAATRARAQLTLLAPDDAARRSPFLARLDLQRTQADAEAAVARNRAASAAAASAPQAPARQDLAVPYADKDAAKALGASWDPARKVWYVKPGVDLAPFAAWLPRR